MGRQRRLTRPVRGAAVLGVLMLSLMGCSTQEPRAQAPTTADAETTADADPSATHAPETDDGATSAQAFIDAFESEGLECAPAEEKFWGPGVVEQVNCRGGDHVVVTVRNFEDTGARDDQLVRVQEQACTIAESGQTIQRLATSATWIVMVGGDREVDFEVFGNAVTGLGLDSTDYTC